MMQGRVIVIILLFVASAVRPALATPSESNRTSELQYLAGSWTCTFQTPDGTVHGPLAQSVVAAGGWMKGVVDGSGGFHQEFYLGFDRRQSQWAFAIFDAGGYQLLTSTSPVLDGSVWSDLYPPATGKGTFTEISPTRYSIVSAWSDGSKTVSTREECTRVQS
jgi:hypothetical protein